MKIIALGTTQFLTSCVLGFVETGHDIACLVSLPKEYLPDNSIDVCQLSIQLNCPYLELKDINNEESVRVFQSYAPDLIFSTWPRIIRKNILSLPPYGVIGSHPTSLPLNRGRHPLHWQIILGIENSHLTFFKMDEGIDTGDILLQVPYRIQQNDTISTLSQKVNAMAYEAAKELGQRLQSDGFLSGKKQDDSLANVWRKRSRFDVTIDFRMAGRDILKLIRSFTDPYPCATILYKNHLFHAIKGSKIDLPYLGDRLQYCEPGKILNVKERTLTIKVADCCLEIECQENLEAILKSKKYIHPPLKYLANNPEIIRFFD